MEQIIVRFVSELRKNGLRVSPSESLDAVQALAHAGMDRRRLSRQLLRLTLVKNVNDIPLFNEIFNRFFNRFPAEEFEKQLPELMNQAIFDMEGDFSDHYKIDDDDHDGHEPVLKFQSEIKPEDLEELKSLQEIDPEDSDGSEVLIKLKGYRGKAQVPKPSRRYTQNPLTIDFAKGNSYDSMIVFTHEEQAAMQDVVSRMMLRLRKDMKRLKNDQARGKLHVIRTIQKNYRHDMVPFQVSLRRKRRQKPRLLVLCDVSFSVSHAARFMILLLHTLHNQLLDARSFIFNREIAEITEMLANMPVNDLMEEIDKGELVDLDENSNYGEVFLTFKKKFLENVRGRPAVIILGDGRNNYSEGNDSILEEIREKSRYMIWLTPEERELWSRGDCLIETYGAYCDKVEVVKTIEELSGVVEDLLRDIYADQAGPLDRKRILEMKRAKEEEVYDPASYYTRGRSEAVTPSFDPSARSHW